jgi:C_GCAxxG_C_C family probable redox protein
MVLAVGGHFIHPLPAPCIRMANGFGGGVGGAYQDICGALSGAIMVIGGVYGRTDVRQDDQHAQTLCACYRQTFLDEFGVTACGPLRDQVKAPGGAGTCAVVVERAALLLLKLLEGGQDAAPRP